MTPIRDFTNLEICRAIGGLLHWPDPISAPLRTAALWRFVQIKLGEMFGADDALDASLLGCYTDPTTRTDMDSGSRAHSAWVVRQHTLGKPDCDAALRRQAKAETAAHGSRQLGTKECP